MAEATLADIKNELRTLRNSMEAVGDYREWEGRLQRIVSLIVDYLEAKEKEEAAIGG